LRSDVVQIRVSRRPRPAPGLQERALLCRHRPTGVCSKRHGCWPGANGPRQARGEL